MCEKVPGTLARASLEELRLDYADFLRHRGLCEWARKDPRREALVALRPTTAEDVAGWVKKVCQDGQRAGGENAAARVSPAEAAANAALTLINVAGMLLDRQLAAQAKAFEREGGFSERLYRVRRGERRKT